MWNGELLGRKPITNNRVIKESKIYFLSLTAVFPQMQWQGVPRGAHPGRRREGVPQEVRALRHLREAAQLDDALQRQGRRHLLQELLREEVRRTRIQG